MQAAGWLAVLLPTAQVTQNRADWNGWLRDWMAVWAAQPNDSFLSMCMMGLTSRLARFDTQCEPAPTSSVPSCLCARGGANTIVARNVANHSSYKAVGTSLGPEMCRESLSVEGIQLILHAFCCKAASIHLIALEYLSGLPRILLFCQSELQGRLAKSGSRGYSMHIFHAIVRRFGLHAWPGLLTPCRRCGLGASPAAAAHAHPVVLPGPCGGRNGTVANW